MNINHSSRIQTAKDRLPEGESFRARLMPLIILALVAALAYANAWPNVLIWDDGVFLVGDRLSGVNFDDIRSFFTQDVWATVGASSGLYRPLLLLSVALDIWIFGEWMAGFHLVNIALHVLVTLVVFGFVRSLLLSVGDLPGISRNAALLAALVFAVHPIHTEVVNSVFNRSEMLVSLGVVGGLWWFLRAVKLRPARAWGVLALIYLLVMLFRETGVMLPAITVVFLWILSTGDWRQRLRKCSPVLWLLIPLAIYFGLRAYALGSHLIVGESVFPVPGAARVDSGLEVVGLYYDFGNILPAVSIWFDSIRLILWPNPLLTFHTASETNSWMALMVQLSLIAFAATRLRNKKPGLILGLAFFYLSLLPSSRIFGEYASFPVLSERNLYMPSVGLTIVLAFGLVWLTQRFNFRTALVPVVLVMMVMTPLTWARNSLWTSNVRLAMADYYGSGQSGMILPTVVKTLYESGNLARAETICDNHTEDYLEFWRTGGNCAQVYASLGRYESAEQAFQLLIDNNKGRAPARLGLAAMYVSLNRKEEAENQFRQALLEEDKVFIREYQTAVMLLRLYPTDRERALEAKAHLEASLELQPQFYLARQMLERLDRGLNAIDNQ